MEEKVRMASANFDEFLSRLKEMDLSAIVKLLQDYYSQKRNFHNLRKQANRIKNELKGNIPDLDKNEKAFREELRARANSCANKNMKASYEQCIGVTSEGYRKTSWREILQKIIEGNASGTVAIVNKYKNLIRTNADVEAIFNEEFVQTLTAYPSKWSEQRNAKKSEPDDYSAIETKFVNEIKGSIDNFIINSNPNLFDRKIDEWKSLSEKIDEAIPEFNEIRREIIRSISEIDLSELLEYVKKNPDKLNQEQIKDGIQRIIDYFRTIPPRGLPEPGNKSIDDYLKRRNKEDSLYLEQDIEKIIREQLRFESDVLPPGDKKSSRGSISHEYPVDSAQAHYCGAPCITKRGKCHRRTTNEEYCYQHSDNLDKDSEKLAGKWRLSGRQVGLEHSHWEAELVLMKNGRLTWKETKGANIGAKRSGRWSIKNSTFTMSYKAPKTGLVVWEAHEVKVTAIAMNGEYRTPQIDTKGYGWGGTWHADKVRE
jgi:hypothetical protein